MARTTMSPIDAYLASLEPGPRALFEQMFASVRSQAPGTEDGISYGMPAILYRGKALTALMTRKGFLSFYPFSGRAIDSVRSRLDDLGFQHSSGSIHFSEQNPLPTSLFHDVVAARVQEIDAQLSQHK